MDSPHVLDVLARGEVDGRPYFVMPLLEGTDLGSLVREEGPLTPEHVVACLRQVARGLEEAHRAGIVHRDLKPSNLFLSHDDEGAPIITVLDFGIAKADDGLAPPTRAILGTPMYLAPEQVRHRRVPVGPAADLYALGQVAYALLVGEAYWRAEDESADTELELMMEAAFGLPEPASERARRRRGVVLPRAFDAWFAKAAAVDPQARFASASDAVESLARALEGQEPEAVPRTPRASRGTLALGALAGLGVLAAVLWSASTPQEPAGPTSKPVTSTPSPVAPERTAPPATTEASPPPPAPSAEIAPLPAPRPPPAASPPPRRPPPPSSPKAWKPPITER